ncbi:MAG TPA: M56 family metallopeptidase [Terriglobales bacterium]|nr:M56 family metallopeptidase [Terriglobales bacterium]
MFALRGIAVSLTFFVLLYCLLSALVAVSWRWLRVLRAAEKSVADLLFLLRILPLVLSIIVTAAFVIPSFQILEPHAVDEGMGKYTFVFGIAALLLIVYGSYRVVAAQVHTSRIVARWLDGASPLETGEHAATLRARNQTPPLTLIGMTEPRVLVSDAAVQILADEELRVALRHELAHIRSWDNLKKLIFRFAPFPGLAKLEAAWSQAAELAADDAAVSDVNDALDLAAALVKLSRLVPVEAAPACTVGFVTGSIRARIARLLAWEEGSQERRRLIPRWLAIPPVLVAILCAFVAYTPVLAFTHELTEWLVR